MSQGIKIVPNDILTEKDRGELLRACLTSVCKHLKSETRDYLHKYHNATGALMRSISYRIWKNKTNGAVGKIYVKESKLEKPEGSDKHYYEYILGGTRDNVQTGDRKFGGGKIGVMHFNPNGKGFDAKREVFFTKRKGIKKDDFFERVMNNQDRAIQDILVEVLRDYGRK